MRTRNIYNRIKKVEKKSEIIKAEADKIKAKLEEIERLEKDEPLKAMFLRAELKYGQKVGIAEMLAKLYRKKKMTKNLR